YEPMIRRAAGLGRATLEPDPDHYEQAHLHTDVLVVGGGVAGLMAAASAAAAGARVVLCEETAHLGGRAPLDGEMIDGAPAQAWVEAMAARLAAEDTVRVFTRTTVQGLYDHGVARAIERVADHLAEPPDGQPRQRAWTIRAASTVVATGGHERPLVFPDNDRPGVMLASAARSLLTGYGVAVGRAPVIATTNDDAYLTAYRLLDAGVEVAAILDARPEPGPEAARAAAIGLRVLPGTAPAGVVGAKAVRAVDALELASGGGERIACDAVLVSGGWNPAVHLTTHLGHAPVWREAIGAFVPDLPEDGPLLAAGTAAGHLSLTECLARGRLAGIAAAARCGHTKPAPSLPAAEILDSGRPVTLWQVPARGKAFVDFQNDVTAKDLALAQRENYASIEHTKRYTTLGMATDQGKTSGVNAIGIVADLRGVSPADIGTTTFRPPYTPVAVATFAGHAVGKHHAPTRRSGLHDWHARHGATFVEAGQWLRPQIYGRPGESMFDATMREVRQVRSSVGICDVSTLGKIDLYGPDAATFLNLLYANAFAKLPVGKVRYGLMLREDGHVFDDGTVSRLAEDRFFVTCTTANAGPVLAHMEYAHEVLWPELDVAMCTATEQWCSIAVAGPKSREVLAKALPAFDVSAEALPFMGVREGVQDGVATRVFRISFSGELAYELAVPWGHGEALWTRLLAAGAPFGIIPYGTEALGVMRIEKGHPAGPELNGQTMAQDLGMARLMKKTGDFIGRAMAHHRAAHDPDRPVLVGLKPRQRDQRLRAGAHLLDPDQPKTLETSLGWVSSCQYSPECGHWIALGLLKGGRQDDGGMPRRLVAAYPLKNEWVDVLVVDPCFVDPDGSRLHA
ncbi:MAG: FAD-dependent oxidoreductase, partial [Rhodospirillaceae bacterium]|nr:FAD-dependent oxidoreductase [Rhodospirillaceae bacterium]